MGRYNGKSVARFIDNTNLIVTLVHWYVCTLEPGMNELCKVITIMPIYYNERKVEVCNVKIKY